MHQISVDGPFTQMETMKEIKMHSEKSIAAIYKECTQIEDMKVMRSLHTKSLIKPQIRGALCKINLVREKKCGKLKVSK